MENIYEMCFWGGMLLAAFFLVISIVLFVVLRIPKVIDEVTGHSARKTIKEDTLELKTSAVKRQSQHDNQHSGKIRVREAVSDRRKREKWNETTKLRKTDNESTALLAPKNILSPFDSEDTEILPLDNAPEITDVLRETGDGNITIVLTEMKALPNNATVNVIYCAIVTHTNESV